MQITTNYNTQNFNGKVNFLTMLRNNFSKTGRQANVEIVDLLSIHPRATIEQTRLNSPKRIILSAESSDTDTFYSTRLVITKDGIKESEESHSRFLDKNKKFKLTRTIQNFFENKEQIHPSKSYETEIVENTKTKKREEYALKNSSSDGIEINVVTNRTRESEFPTTHIAKNLHPQLATRTYYSDGDILYIEKHLTK